MIRAGTAIAVVLLGGIALAGCKPPETVEQSEPAPVSDPELYGVLHSGIYGPMRYEGGDEDTCGAWAANDPADARQMLADCPPLTKGELP